MRAVKLLEAHRLELVDIPAPESAPGEVVIRVEGCGICGSDLTSYKVGLFTDTVPGHEIAGVIDSVGDGVVGWAAGEPAVIDPKIPCGVCDDCRNGASYRCAMALTAGIGFARDGGFAELVATPAALLHRLPAGLALEHACLVEPLSVAIHGVDRARLHPGDPVVVIGLGPIGLLTVATLHARGMGPIIGVEPVEDRRLLALDLGAATVVSELREVRSHTGPTPAVIECSGYAPLLHAAADLVAPGGRLVLVGVPFGETSVIPLMWVTREIEIIGSIASNEADFAVSLAMLAADPGIARVATRRVSLAQVPEVFEELITPSSGGKVVVDPGL
jgi:(R,R)-butanediol dehydrogenase / meso-butanediol dehydrogenase / diacetyl reductase